MKAEYFNDDKLGRVLDQLYQKGLSEILMSLVLKTVKMYQLEIDTVNIDSSSFHVHGDDQLGGNKTSEEQESKVIKITYGYSKDRRQDLKQFLLDLICTGHGDVPLGF